MGRGARALRRQAGVYERLAADTGLDVRVYCRSGRDVPRVSEATIHVESAPEVGTVWLVASLRAIYGSPTRRRSA